MSAEPETAQTLDRGLQVLEQLSGAAGHGGLTVSELAQALGVGRSVVYRLVTTLVARDYVRRGQDGRFRLGLASSRLAVAVRPALVEAARPVLRALADQLGATAHLTVVEAGSTDALAVLVVEPSWTDFHVAYRVGSRHPLTQGAAGRALLAGRRGSARAVTTQGELQVGAHGVAAPVTGVPSLEASVGVVSMTPIRERGGADAVELAAQQVAAALGTTRQHESEGDPSLSD
ncbi:IclR family transcriptional regulator [Ornithinimicrobium cavernae]|uniref:IclR family transcriptional regulator n=1 Tax=Ornithinimicrobium cavernae TaxID=2666047 RepID=UPI000D687F81|nr:helix-turn-helix domain-containing protein [Ornithinimicrobium cavernae]